MTSTQAAYTAWGRDVSQYICTEYILDLIYHLR